MNPLVSIITPCFNGEKYLDRYFNSLLHQDYDECQLIFMDDGSSDNTRLIVEEYIGLLENKGFSVEYHYNDNHGQAFAVGEGIKYIKGKYYIWPDADDILTYNSISKRVEFLEKHNDYAVVRSECKVVYEDDLQTEVERSAQKNGNRFVENLYHNCLTMTAFYFQPGCYMVRTEALLKINPNRYIYKSRAGQNIQMLLPILYYSKCGYIDEPLYVYVRSKSSHSNSLGCDFESKIKRLDSFIDVYEMTIKNTLIGEKKESIKENKSAILKRKIDLSFQAKKKSEAKKYYAQLRQIGSASAKDYLKTVFCGNALFEKVLITCRSIRWGINNERK